MFTYHCKLGCGLLVLALAMTASWHGQSAYSSAPTPESKALAYLIREVPAWSTNNGCFSCHNNGDAARALYVAARKGRRVPPAALAATTQWLSAPAHWEENKGDPGFSDKRLAAVQFSSTLLTAIEASQIRSTQTLHEAARKLIAEQVADGSWEIDAGNTLGSPATYGTPLATWMALRVLREAKLPESTIAVRRAESWLRRLQPQNVFTAATIFLFAARETDAQLRRKKSESLALIRRAQTRDGGWGPYADAPAEVFDTALVLLALAESPQQPSVKEMVQRGRAYLSAQQTVEGNWPPTTRPSGGDSYAQMMSTTGWATLALLMTSE